MDWLYIFFVFLFGTIIGSFLNVVSLRFNTGFGVKGRSRCFSCAKTLTWIELLPIVSWISLRGKCRSCSTKISIQYPIVELVTGILFVLLAWRFPFFVLSDDGLIFALNMHNLAMLVLHFCIASVLVVISVYDLKHKIIPDSLALIFGVLGFVVMLIRVSAPFAEISPFIAGYAIVWEFLSGIVLALPFALLWLISRGRWIGLGDAKLAVGIGYVLGISLGFSAVMIAFWAGAVIGVLCLCLPKSHSTMKTEIPFAPFLIFGFYCVLLTTLNVFDTSLLFQ